MGGPWLAFFGGQMKRALILLLREEGGILLWGVGGGEVVSRLRREEKVGAQSNDRARGSSIKVVAAFSFSLFLSRERET